MSEAYTYILQSLKNNKYYIGSTNDLERRIKEHNNGTGCVYTKSNGPWELFMFREFDDIQLARAEEKKVKSYKGGNAFKKIINGEMADPNGAPSGVVESGTEYLGIKI